MKLILILGACGVLMELVFTGFMSLMREHDKNLVGRVSLWMLPAYTVGAFLLLQLRAAWFMPELPPLRWAIYVLVIYLFEYAAGAIFFLCRLRPWLYENGWHVHGMVRLDYAPAWVLAACTFDILIAELGGLG